jgi:small-conductance mechanosensitive channel
MNRDSIRPLSWLSWELYHNPLSAWLLALGAVVGGVVLLLLAKRIVVNRLERFARHTPTKVDDLAVDVLQRTRVYFLAAIAIRGASLALTLPQGVRNAIWSLVVLAICLQAARWGNGIITFWVGQYTTQRPGVDGATATTVIALGYVARLVLWLVILLLALDNFGVNVTTLIAGLGITGVAVALAVQNILGDLLAALSIVLDKPFVVGDFIIVDQTMGTVESVGIKTTRIRSISGEQIVIANADLLKARIRNMKRLVERRVLFVTTVSYNTPPETVERIPGMLREIVTAQSPVRFDRAHFRSYGESALEFETVYFVLSDDYNKYMDIQQAINLELLRRFHDEGIEFPFPTRTIITRVDGAGAGPVRAGAE